MNTDSFVALCAVVDQNSIESSGQSDGGVGDAGRGRGVAGRSAAGCRSVPCGDGNATSRVVRAGDFAGSRISRGAGIHRCRREIQRRFKRVSG